MNHKKHWFSFGVISIIVFVMVGCVWLMKQGKEPENISMVYLPKIIDETNEFWTALIAGANTAAQEYNVKLEIKAAKKETDFEYQNQLIQEILERKEKPDALLISPASYKESTKLLKKVKEQGIRLVMIDSDIDEDIADMKVSTDNVEAGKKLGKYTAEILQEGKQVAVVGHVPEASTAIDRERGFLDGLGERKSDFTEIVYCGSQYEKAYELAKELIEKYPELGVIAGLNEYSAIGAARAIRDLGVQDRIHMVGIDSSKEGVSFMEQGIFKGIVIQKPFKMGYLGVKHTVEMLSGSVLPKQMNAGSELVNIDNMYFSENEKLLFPFNEKQDQ